MLEKSMTLGNRIVLCHQAELAFDTKSGITIL